MPDRWIVVSLDGLGLQPLGPYGSSWNDTPALDRLAAEGTVWDRVVVDDDDPVATLAACWKHLKHGTLQGRSATGGSSAELFLEAGPQAERLAGVAAEAGFESCVVIDAAERPAVAQEIEQTSAALLTSVLVERLEAGESESWSLLWIHSDFLCRRWDAPRRLFPIDPGEASEPAEAWDDEAWEDESIGESDADRAASRFGDDPDSEVFGEATKDGSIPPPPLFDSLEPPRHRCSPDDHPDLITSWMQTYGCQVRLVDQLIGWIREAADRAAESLGEPIGLAVIGTGGFSLGAGGWIGCRAGPLCSPEIHVPMIAGAGLPASLRRPRLVSLPDAVAAILGDKSPPAPQEWAESVAAMMNATRVENTETYEPGSAAIRTVSSRAELAVTTPRWFLVRDGDGSRLYLKPDDRDDANDVADRCGAVVEGLTAEFFC